MMLSEEDRQKLAQKLAGLSYKAARKEIRKLDGKANLKIWRNGVGPGELHTTYELPNLGVKVTLVERAHARPEVENKKIKKKYLYTEARVEPMAVD
jgi:hypothetical protein